MCICVWTSALCFCVWVVTVCLSSDNVCYVLEVVKVCVWVAILIVLCVWVVAGFSLLLSCLSGDSVCFYVQGGTESRPSTLYCGKEASRDQSRQKCASLYDWHATAVKRSLWAIATMLPKKPMGMHDDCSTQSPLGQQTCLVLYS